MPKPIFREYIGVKPNSETLHDFPHEIIDTENLEFHFILGFATESYYESGKSTGNFEESWDSESFGLENVKKLKERYPEVKVVISIGGRGVQTPFHPAEENVWVENAQESLKQIFQKYSNESGSMIDGIDINYEHISSDEPFARLVGLLITELKKDDDLNINVVSIAPSETNSSHYQKLYNAKKDYINWVDYQFSNQHKPVHKDDHFVEIFKTVEKDYHLRKVLPGFSTDPDDAKHNKITRDVFIGGCTRLKQTSSLPGVFFWNAHDSVTPRLDGDKPFIVELTLQQLLAK
uniref:Putative narbonin n=1 Tax=Glycine max TaxID=3847 RepID=Q39888_SOYBN|nr:putative narbonin [Glycine max]